MSLVDRYSDLVRKLILERISNGIYQPGDRLVELQLSKELGISLAPIREALGKLAAQRIIDREPYKAARIRKVEARDLSNSIDVLWALENLAAERGFQRLQDRTEDLQKAAEAFMNAAKEKKKGDYSRAYIAFHRIIIEASENDTLLEIWESMSLELTILTGELFEGPNRKVVALEHLDLVERFKKSDKKGICRLIKDLHLDYRD